MRTAPASNQKMSKESSPALQCKLIPASEVKETITPVSHPTGLTELTASLEALNTEVDKRLTVVHCTQTSSSSRANKIPGSPDMRDQKKTSPTPIHQPRRYALEMWLEVEVGPRLFVPPEDDSYSVDFAMEVINRAYPGLQECTWIELATCWPFMVEKAAREPASFKMSRSRPAELWVNFPCGWDTQPDGELDASASRRLMKF